VFFLGSAGAGGTGYAARSAKAYSMSQQQYSTSMAATPMAPGVGIVICNDGKQ
jgi:hypothetical protein